MRKAIEPRYISPESISVGDAINVVIGQSDGVTVSKHGTVATRDVVGRDTILYTSLGGEIMRYSQSFRPLRITLLARVEPSDNVLALFDIERKVQ